MGIAKKAAAAIGSAGELQYTNNFGNLAGTPDMTFHPGVPGNSATYLQVVNEVNDEDVNFEPRGVVSVENSNTDHSAHISGWKSRGTFSNPARVRAGDYLAGFVSHGFSGIGPYGGYERAGYCAYFVSAVESSGHLTTDVEIRVSKNGVELNVYDASADATVIRGTLQVVQPDNAAYAMVQGKLTTDTNFTSGPPTPTGYLVLYDANGIAYKVGASRA